MANNKITDQIIKSADRLTLYNLVDNTIMATVNQLQSVTIDNSQETVWYSGKSGQKIAGFDRNKAVEMTASNGYIDIGYLGAQTGSDVEVYDGVTKFIYSPYIDEIETADGITAKTSYTAYSAATGAEIAYIYKLHGSGIVGAEKFTQDSAADATHFAYDPATGIIDLPTGVFDAGEILVAQYNYRASGTGIVNNSDSFSKSAKGVLDLTTQDICTDEITHSQFIFYKCKVDGNFSISIGDSPAVHQIKLSSTASTCFGANRNLFDYNLVNPV